MCPLWEDIFRGYDIRARYPDQLDETVAYSLGQALARALRRPFLVGRDARRESGSVAAAVEAGIRSSGFPVESVGIVPTPAVAFLARQKNIVGICVTPSHNALGYVGVKGFTATGRVFDREWPKIRDTFNQGLPVRQGRHRAIHRRRTYAEAQRSIGPGVPEEYLQHLTAGLESHRTIVVDCRGGATAQSAPSALRRMGAHVVEVTRGYSPNFFGRSPEPGPDDLGELSRWVLAKKADAGFAFDGDGDRCVVVDRRGRPVASEVVALLLHSMVAPRRSVLVASVDASRVLEEQVRTVRSRVGSRFVLRTMRRTAAQVGMEPSGHYYVRSYGPDSDGVLVACLVAQALERRPDILDRWRRKVGALHRGTATIDFGSSEKARRGLRRIVRSLGSGKRVRPEGLILDFPVGWCLVRCSNTQPSIRFAFESTTRQTLHQLERKVRRLEEVARGAEP